MAIINCPECHEKISTLAKQCVHCGAKIRVCPECGDACLEGTSICPTCGYAFPKNEKTSHENHPQKEKKSEKQHEKKKMNAGKFDELVGKNAPGFSIVDILGFLCSWSPYIMLLWLCLKLQKWSDGSGQMLVEYENVQSFAVCILVIACVLMLLDVILSTNEQKNFLQSYIHAAKQKQISLYEIIENTLNIDYAHRKSEFADEQAKSLSFVLNAEIYDTELEAKNKFSLWVSISLICKVVHCLCLFFFLKHNIDIYMQAELFKSDMLNLPGWSLKSVENWWLVILLVISEIIQSVYTSIIKKRSSQKKCEWVSKNFPQKVEVYTEYLDGFYSIKKMSDDMDQNNTRGGI